MRLQFIFILIITSFSLQAQNEAKTLYFGRLGIDFRTNPINFLTNSGMDATENAASICDANGDILFYTNGGESPGNNQTVGGIWNKNHVLMANGILDDSSGCISSYHGSIILPVPSVTKVNGDEYYVFTRDCIESSVMSPNFNAGLRYSKVDMSLNGGLGEVVEKNVSVVPFVASTLMTNREPLAACKHENGNDFWLFSYNNDSLYSLKITASGIGDYRTYFPEEGKISISPAGNFIYIQSRLYSFDRNSGDLGFVHDFQDDVQCFSPNGSKMYVSAGTSVYQYDLEAANIPASEQTLISGAGWATYEKLYLAPNGKIYLKTQNDNAFAGIIHCPNSTVADCGLDFTTIALPQGYDLSGNFTNVVADYLFNDPGTCNLGLTEVNAFRLSVFPNPSKDRIQINLSKKGSYSIQLFDLKGKEIRKAQFKGDAHTISCADLESGQYLIQIDSDNFVAVKKIIIQN